MSSYYLGSVGDRVFMHPGSSGTLVGPSSTQLYYKDLLDSLGVRIQQIRHGSYKSAGEPYVRSEMSEENLQQYQALLGSIWEGFPGIHGKQGGADPALQLRFPGSGFLGTLRGLRQVPARFRPAFPGAGAHVVHLDGRPLPDNLLIQHPIHCHLRKSISADFVYLCKLLKR